ncbi:hypothetical protein HAX54_046552, partial [Datura stramonium]|nr:hypothetical protein [Datura stramonium]
AVKKWWAEKGNSRLKVTFQAVPLPIIWFLWKRRNTVHRGAYTVNKVIWEVNDNIHKLLKLRFKGVWSQQFSYIIDFPGK